MERSAMSKGGRKRNENTVSRANGTEMDEETGKGARIDATLYRGDEDADGKTMYRSDDSHEANVSAGRLSITSPLGRALIGTAPGDSVEVSTPSGSKSYEVVKVRYN